LSTGFPVLSVLLVLICPCKHAFSLEFSQYPDLFFDDFPPMDEKAKKTERISVGIYCKYGIVNILNTLFFGKIFLKIIAKHLTISISFHKLVIAT